MKIPYPLAIVGRPCGLPPVVKILDPLAIAGSPCGLPPVVKIPDLRYIINKLLCRKNLHSMAPKRAPMMISNMGQII